MKSSVIIVNPAALRASAGKIAVARELLLHHGYEAELLETHHAGHATTLARDVLARRPDLVIAAGGDGTINEVVNGIAGSGVPLAILPVGTANVLARELRIPADIRRAAERAASGTAREMFLGEIGPPDRSRVRKFCLMAGIGFDGATVRDVRAQVKKISGRAAYVLSGVGRFLGYSPERLRFVVDGREHFGTAAVIGNAAKYGGEFRVTPDANIFEPGFWCCIFQGSKRRDLLRFLASIPGSRHTRLRDVRYLRAETVEVYGNAPIQVDGDYEGTAPARITVSSATIMIVS